MWKRKKNTEGDYLYSETCNYQSLKWMEQLLSGCNRQSSWQVWWRNCFLGGSEMVQMLQGGSSSCWRGPTAAEVVDEVA